VKHSNNDNIHHDQDRAEIDNRTPYSQNKDQEVLKDFGGCHFRLIGSSIVKDLKAKLIYRYRKTKVTTLRDKTVSGAKEFIELEKGKQFVFKLAQTI